VLRDACVIVSIYGRESDADWLVDLIGSSMDSSDRLSAVGVSKVLALAESLKTLACTSRVRRDELCEKLVANAIGAFGTSRDLEAYEALSIELRVPHLEEVARQRAREVLGDEIEHLLCNVDDPENMLLGAEDIDRRARWYQLDLNIGPLLDKANEIAYEQENASGWPDGEMSLDDEDPSTDADGIRRIFSRFNE
jgi:hypothetical protein